MQHRLTIGVLLLVPSLVAAQSERFELGQRLRAFEKAWDRTNDAAGKKRSVTPLNQAVRSFFTFNFGGVGESLDRARHALRSAEPPPFDVRWAESLSAHPGSRLINADQNELPIEVKPFYRVAGDAPKEATARLKIGDGPPVDVALGKLPQTVKLSLKELAGPKSADLLFEFDVMVEGRILVSRSAIVSRVEFLTDRLGLLRKFADTIDKAATIERATLRSLVNLLTDLAEKKVLETSYPAARILAEAEALVSAIRKEAAYYDATKAGQFWLTVPTVKGDVPVRIFVPERLDRAKPVPVIVALHGAGGSENLFFDGYGDGITMKTCRERGWILVAPRAGGGLGIGGPPPVTSLLDELTKRYPIDASRVYLVGHSMGAGHVVAIAQQSPERFAGAAALGGGGSLRASDGIRKLPFFIGCGKEDFALGTARALADAFKKAKADKLRFQEYDDIEHMMIVRQAIPDVFKFWDGK